jgi:AraC family transcriptional regulator
MLQYAKQEKMMEFLNRLEKAIEYIEANLAGEISFDQAARIACCSTFYFQRMFSYISGVPLSEYIRRRRMAAAAFELQNRAATVTDIALKYGYNSPTAFNRAFQSVHGIPPSAVWTKNVYLNSYPRLHLQISVTGNESLLYRIENRGPIRLVGLKMQLAADMEENFLKIPQFWQEIKDNSLLAKFISLMNAEPQGMLGLSLYQGDEDISYMIGVASKEAVPEGFAEVQLPALTWAVFPCVGPLPSTFQDLYRRFYTEWLPVSDFHYRNGPDLEVYPEDNITSSSCSSELWMAVTKE